MSFESSTTRVEPPHVLAAAVRSEVEGITTVRYA